MMILVHNLNIYQINIDDQGISPIKRKTQDITDKQKSAKAVIPEITVPMILP